MLNKTDLCSSSPVNSSVLTQNHNNNNDTHIISNTIKQDDPSKPSRTVCSVCNKKTGLATSFICKCGLNNCSVHRYSNTHSCTYDWIAEKKAQLIKANPVVVADKIQKV